MNQFPIVGKVYEVIAGPYVGFVGECVSVRPEGESLPVILEDFNFNGRAVKFEEIKECLKQPEGTRVAPTN